MAINFCSICWFWELLANKFCPFRSQSMDLVPDFTSRVISELGGFPKSLVWQGKVSCVSPTVSCYSGRQKKGVFLHRHPGERKRLWDDTSVSWGVDNSPSSHSLRSYPLPGNIGAILTPLLSPLFQVVSLGLYFGDQAYLRSSWNILDGFLVFVSLIDIVVSVASAGGAKILGVLRVLRLLRTLRPLRSEPHRVLFGPRFPLVIPRRSPRVRYSCARQSVVLNKQ